MNEQEKGGRWLGYEAEMNPSVWDTLEEAKRRQQSIRSRVRQIGKGEEDNDYNDSPLSHDDDNNRHVLDDGSASEEYDDEFDLEAPLHSRKLQQQSMNTSLSGHHQSGGEFHLSRFENTMYEGNVTEFPSQKYSLNARKGDKSHVLTPAEAIRLVMERHAYISDSERTEDDFPIQIRRLSLSKGSSSTNETSINSVISDSGHNRTQEGKRILALKKKKHREDTHPTTSKDESLRRNYRQNPQRWASQHNSTRRIPHSSETNGIESKENHLSCTPHSIQQAKLDLSQPLNSSILLRHNGVHGSILQLNQKEDGGEKKVHNHLQQKQHDVVENYDSDQSIENDHDDNEKDDLEFMRLISIKNDRIVEGEKKVHNHLQQKQHDVVENYYSDQSIENDHDDNEKDDLEFMRLISIKNDRIVEGEKKVHNHLQQKQHDVVENYDSDQSIENDHDDNEKDDLEFMRLISIKNDRTVEGEKKVHNHLQQKQHDVVENYDSDQSIENYHHDDEEESMTEKQPQPSKKETKPQKLTNISGKGVARKIETITPEDNISPYHDDSDSDNDEYDDDFFSRDEDIVQRLSTRSTTFDGGNVVIENKEENILDEQESKDDDQHSHVSDEDWRGISWKTAKTSRSVISKYSTSTSIWVKASEEGNDANDQDDDIFFFDAIQEAEPKHSRGSANTSDAQPTINSNEDEKQVGLGWAGKITNFVGYTIAALSGGEEGDGEDNDISGAKSTLLGSTLRSSMKSMLPSKNPPKPPSSTKAVPSRELEIIRKCQEQMKGQKMAIEIREKEAARNNLENIRLRRKEEAARARVRREVMAYREMMEGMGKGEKLAPLDSKDAAQEYDDRLAMVKTIEDQEKKMKMHERNMKQMEKENKSTTKNESFKDPESSACYCSCTIS